MLRAFVAFTVLCAHGVAETETSASGVPASVELVQPTPAPQASPTDRKDGSGAAIALAAAGAAIAGMSCAMLMKQAQEAPTESERNMLNMMAMQQCAQAAQNLANAAQNQKGKDGLTSPAGPAAPQLKSEAQPTKEAKADPTTGSPQATATEAFANIESPTPAPATETASGVVAPEVFNGKPSPKEEVKVAAGGPSLSVPKVIPKNGVEFDDGAKAGSGTTTPFGQPNFLGQNGAQNPPGANKDLKQLLTGDPRAINGRKGKNAGSDTHGEGSGGGGDSKDGKGNESDMSAMLAQLMGGAPAAGDGVGGLSNQVMNLKEFAKAGGAGDGEELPNVFQYASYRFRQLHQERAVRVFSGALTSTPAAATISVSVSAPVSASAKRKPVAKTPTEKKLAGKKLIGKPVAMRTASARRGGKR